MSFNHTHSAQQRSGDHQILQVSDKRWGMGLDAESCHNRAQQQVVEASLRRQRYLRHEVTN